MSVLKTFKISFFLASRQIKNANLWVNILIIFIMAVTFLNLVFISGLLEGLVTGASKDSREHYSGEIIITPEDEKVNIVNTTRLIEEVSNISQIDSYTVRYLQGAQIEASYSPFQEPNVERNLTNGILTGISFENENKVTDLEKFIIDGEYVYSNPQNKVLIGSGLLAEYDSAIEGGSLEGVNVGDKIKITASGTPKEYVVSGILKAKLSQINNRVFIDRQQFISLTGRSPQLSDEIAISLSNPQEVELVKGVIKETAKNSQAKTETWQESQGQFFEDLSMTFTILGAVIGAIGLAVASVTLFIVIFINAISRERYIGILKGIGVDSSIIKYSYVFQSIFYALIGSVIGLLLLYIILIPYFNDNPIDFPFSDGILDVTVDGVIIRVLILFISSVAAGFIPSHLIVKKNTIDSILGR
jgi:putative ABC transport system permease protein